MTPDLDNFQSRIDQARQEIKKIIIGQEDVIDLMIITILTRQHALVEGVPGIAKTLLVRVLAHVLGVEFNRIQFTPDLMPADITGTNVYNLQENKFELVKGPLFTSFLLGDEINRAPAKTQSAMLQAMQEHAITIDRDTHILSDNFTVFATQNPIEYEGTYPLPEAQKDRFMIKIIMDCPGRDDEIELARRSLGAQSPERQLEQGVVQPVLGPKELEELRPTLEAVTLRDELVQYMVDIVRRTRAHESILVGAGPRATQSLVLATRALSCIEKRDYVTPDDVKRLAIPVLAHRLILRPEYEIEGLSINEVVESILKEIPVPR